MSRVAGGVSGDQRGGNRQLPVERLVAGDEDDCPALADIDDAMTAVIDLGGRCTGERHDYDEGVVVVMADPEDHEFCLVEYYG